MKNPYKALGIIINNCVKRERVTKIVRGYLYSAHDIVLQALGVKYHEDPILFSTFKLEIAKMIQIEETKAKKLEEELEELKEKLND